MENNNKNNFQNSQKNKENRIKEIIKEILGNKDSILETSSFSETVYSLNKFETLVKDFEKYDRRKYESEETKKRFIDKRNPEKNRITAYLLELMKNKITFFENELNIASTIQNKLMPQNIPNIEGYDIHALYSPSREVGGDYYDFYIANDGNIYFLISDVSGKGLPSSLTVASMKAYITAQIEENKPIIKIIKNLNNFLNETLISDKFVTMFIGKLDPIGSSISYINAGHNPPIILKNGNEMVELTEGGTILGMFKDLSFDTGSIQFSEDDILALYTDGITEAFNSSKEMFSKDRLKHFIKTEYNKSLKDIAESIFNEVKLFCGENTPQDDITLLFIRKKNLNEHK